MVYLVLALILLGLWFYPEAVLAGGGGGSPAGNAGADSTTKMFAAVSALSVASERVVEIIKGFFQWLNEAKPDPREEGHRKAVLQILAVGAAMVILLLARPLLRETLGGWLDFPEILAVALLAGGGSGFWNAFNTFVGEVKNLKKADAQEKLLQVAVMKKQGGIP